MDDLKKLTLTELKDALENVNKTIDGEKKFMGIAKDAFIENGEVCLIYGVKLMKLKDLTNEKNGKLLYNEKQILRVRKYIDDMKILYKRNKDIFEEIKRRELGDEFIDNLKLYDLKQEGTKIIYHNKESMREFLLNLIKEEKYKYVLINKIKYFDERMDDKKYIVYALLISKPKGDYSKIEAGEITIDGLMGGIASTERELWRRIDLKKPEPIKSYNNIDLLENLNNPEKRLIRDVEKEAEVNDYKLVVEKGDNNRVNYVLYESEKYYEYIIRLENILLEICKEWNDEEYLRVMIDLNSWKRKEKSSSTDGIIKFLSEIYGKYELWYAENNLEAPELDKYILKFRAGIVVIVSRILELMVEKKNLEKQLDELEDEYNKDVPNFPEDLSHKLDRVEKDILSKEKIIDEFKIRLWGILGKEEGVIYRHDRLVREFKKMKLGNDYRFEILDERSTEKMNKILGDKIKNILTERQVTIDEYELNELLLKVIGNRLSNEEQFYEEVLQPEKVEQNVNIEIIQVLNEKYNFNVDLNSMTEYSKIKFATPRLNRDERIIELNGEIADLEYQKMMHKEDSEYVKSAEGLINGRRKELKELTVHLIGDFLLKNNIRELIRITIEKSKNKIGLDYLKELDLDKLKNYLIEEGSNRIFNKIVNNEYENSLNDSELLKLINEEIQKVLPELDKRFLNVEQSSKTEQFKMLWEQVVDSNFKTDAIIKILDEVGYENENELLDYMKRMYSRRTQEEWMKYFEMLDKGDQFSTLKTANLPPEIENENYTKIVNAKYSESEIGKHTFQNLKNFELKFIHTEKQEQQINEIINKQSKSIDYIFPQFRDLLNQKNNANTNSDIQRYEDEKVIDQDTLIEKFQKVCIKRKLVKGKTIPNDILYVLAKEIGIVVPDIKEFKTGNKAYHIAREFASRLGFKRKKPSER